MTTPELVLDIFLTFVRLGLTGFGGTNLAEMERLLVGQHGWIDARTFANGFALGQLMPGPNLLAVTHYGLVIAGGWGAAAATVGLLRPHSGSQRGGGPPLEEAQRPPVEPDLPGCPAALWRRRDAGRCAGAGPDQYSLVGGGGVGGPRLRYSAPHPPEFGTGGGGRGSDRSADWVVEGLPRYTWPREWLHRPQPRPDSGQFRRPDPVSAGRRIYYPNQRLCQRTDEQPHARLRRRAGRTRLPPHRGAARRRACWWAASAWASRWRLPCVATGQMQRGHGGRTRAGGGGVEPRPAGRMRGLPAE